MADRFLPIPPNIDQVQLTAMLNKNFGDLDQDATTKLFLDANKVPTIIIGLLPDGTTGIVIAKEGVDVTTVFD